MIRNEYITTDEDGLTFFIHPKALFFTTAGKQLIKLVKMAGRIGVSKNVLFKKCIHWHISPVVLSKLREHGHIQYNDEAERFYITED